MAEEFGIRVVPMTVRFGDERFEDEDPHAFWRRLHLSSDLPETSAPSVYAFETALKDAANDRAAGAVVVTMSGELSATYENAVMAALTMSGSLPTKVVDSRTLSMAQGFAAIAAAERAAHDGTVTDVAAAALAAAENSGVLAALDTLDFLERGGRIGGASAFVGNLLNVRPVLTVTQGVVASAGRGRSRKAAVNEIVEHVLGLPMVRDLAVVHGHANDVHYLIDSLTPRVPRDRIIDACLGPVMATHTGPGVLGVAYRTA